MAGQRIGDVIEELPHAALVHDLAENDEKNNEGCGYFDGGAVDAINVGGQVSDNALPAVAAVHEHAGQITPEQAIGKEDDRKDGERRAADAPGAFQHEKDQDRTYDHIHHACLEAGGDEHRVADEHIDGHAGGKHDADPVIPGDLLPACLFAGGIQGEAQDQHQAHMKRVVLDVDHLEQAHTRCICQVINGKEQAQNIEKLDEDLRIKAARAGFLVVFFHDLSAGRGRDLVFFYWDLVRFSHG